ncbi:MAG TPA: MFS transporter [Caldilineaceae bacterium]|nr:MFS transporter [Caldilineaceae bacterium]
MQLSQAGAPPGQFSGMRGFLIFWFGQLVSLLGTSMSRFALTIWAWEITGQATALALVGFFSFAPVVLVSPLAGALVDRLPRKVVLMFSDLAAGLASFTILLLYLMGDLQIWHLYVAGAFAGAFESFQFPAFSAAVSTMLPKEQYGRANGLYSLAESASGIAAPVLAGLLLGVIGIGGILTIDVITFAFAVSMLLFIFIPQPPQADAEEGGRGSLWREIVYGFRYIVDRRSLLGLQLLFSASNLLSGLGFVLMPAMVLARTGNDALALGTVQSFLGMGGVAGGLLLSTWGGFRRRVHGVLLGFILISLFQAWLGTGQTLWVWCAAGFLMLLVLPILNGSNQAIWQAKVAPTVQGRVFATRRVIAQISGPVGTLLAGPLADYLFEPAMRTGGALAGAFGWLVGTGPGAGMGLLMVMTGLLGMVVGLVGYAMPVIRNAEEILPDHDAAVQPATTSVSG